MKYTDRDSMMLEEIARRARVSHRNRVPRKLGRRVLKVMQEYRQSETLG